MRRRLLGIRPATSSGWHRPPDAEPSRDGNSTSRVAVSWLTTTQLQGLGFAIDYAAERKRQGDIREIKALLKDGFHPVIFCRFIDTAEYVARHLWEVLRATRVEAVTGRLPRAERETRIQSLVEDGGQFLLVCTDRPPRASTRSNTSMPCSTTTWRGTPRAMSSAQAGWIGSGSGHPAR